MNFTITFGIKKTLTKYLLYVIITIMQEGNMKARQIIEQLQKLNPDTEIKIYSYWLKNTLEIAWIDAKGHIVASSNNFEIDKRRTKNG